MSATNYKIFIFHHVIFWVYFFYRKDMYVICKTSTNKINLELEAQMLKLY